MKKIIGLLLILIAAVGLYAETIESTYYVLTGDVPSQALAETGRTLDTLWSAYNDVFRFSKDGAGFKLPVTVYPEKNTYDAFILDTTGKTRDGYVYLKYSKPDKSSLVLFLSEKVNSDSLVRQSYLQYLYSFIKNPPTWIREGFALYFDGLTVDSATNTAVLPRLSPWLDQVKKIRISADKKLTVKAILTAKNGDYAANDFYPQSWALISFLAKTENKTENRLLWDCFYQLETDATAEKNTAAVSGYIFDWISTDTLDLDFNAWLEANKTFTELVNDGTTLYNQGDYDGAEKLFIAAINADPRAPVPVYYMGLIAYTRANYDEADIFYKTALQNGADTATINWALGLSAYAVGKKEEATVYINTAATAAPDRYKIRAAELLQKMN